MIDGRVANVSKAKYEFNIKIYTKNKATESINVRPLP